MIWEHWYIHATIKKCFLYTQVTELAIKNFKKAWKFEKDFDLKEVDVFIISTLSDIKRNSEYVHFYNFIV